MDDFLDDAPKGAGGTSLAVIQDDCTDVAPLTPQGQTAMMLHGSGLFPNTGSVAGVFTVVQFGKEVGLPPVQALNNVAIINGKLSMSGASMLALGYKHGVTAEFLKEDKESCIIKFEREGHKPYTSEFTIEDAETAGLGDRHKDGAKKGQLKESSVWYKYTKTMLKWRAVAQGMRMIAPDILAGVYTKDEIVNIGAENDTLDIADEVDDVAQKDTPIEPEPEPAQVPESTEEKITEGQMKALHVQMAKCGITPFKEGFKLFLLTFEDTGLTPDKPSATQLTKEFTTVLLKDFDKYASMFFASPKSKTYIDGVFDGLQNKVQGMVIAGMKSMVKGGESFPIEVKADTSPAMVKDWFKLMQTALTNQEHNRIADAGEAKGMTVPEVVETLEELGMNPEVKETTEVPKEEPKKQEPKKDDLMPF